MSKTIVEKAQFICVCFDETNNNKFWRYEIYSDGTAYTEWGRVGRPQGHQDTTKSVALSKMREKTNPNNKPDKLYTKVESVDSVESTSSTSTKPVNNYSLKAIAQKQIKTQSKVVQDLIDFLVKVNSHEILKATGGSIQYDSSLASFKTPMGVILPDQVKEARQLLSDMADKAAKNDMDTTDFNRLLQAYLRLIPHNVGMKKITPALIFPNLNSFPQENTLLDGLETSFNDITSAKPSGKKQDKKVIDEPEIFNVELEIVTDQKIISWARDLYQSTRKDMHQSNSLSVQTVYKVVIKSMAEAFDKYGKKIGNIRDLWHGTKANNLLSIMRKGLIIPPSNSPHCTGRMFGNGAYFSDISTKALNYATSYWGGGGNMDRTFMFLAQVAMGNFYVPRGSYENLPMKGFDSTFAQPGKSGIANNEMIVYDVKQCNLVYLIEFVPRSNYKK